MWVAKSSIRVFGGVVDMILWRCAITVLAKFISVVFWCVGRVSLFQEIGGDFCLDALNLWMTLLCVSSEC